MTKERGVQKKLYTKFSCWKENGDLGLFIIGDEVLLQQMVFLVRTRTKKKLQSSSVGKGKQIVGSSEDPKIELKS